MINKIGVKNFKSHKNTIIDSRNLLVLCGANGVGKSSIIQVLLLLREAYIKDKSFDIIDLKSNPVKIGTVNDAIYEYGEFDGFEILINEFEFYYEANSENQKQKSFIKLNNLKASKSPDYLIKESLFKVSFQYISAARKGPQESYPKDDRVIDIYKQISINEGQAEYFVQFLDAYRNIDVLDDLCIKEDNENYFNDLYTQVILWEKYIFNGANTEVIDLGKIGYQLKYSFDNNYSATKKTQSFDAKNVGFGLTYTLPILVAILSSQKGSLIIIENPEAHLHPSGIARLTELICVAAQAGIQIIIETHSDHIINGILVQSKKHEINGDFGIQNENISIYQFERDEKQHCSVATKIEVEEGGRIRFAPEGFFDQDEIDTDYLFDL
jgi:predicted ATPase